MKPTWMDLSELISSLFCCEVTTCNLIISSANILHGIMISVAELEGWAVNEQSDVTDTVDTFGCSLKIESKYCHLIRKIPDI